MSCRFVHKSVRGVVYEVEREDRKREWMRLLKRRKARRERVVGVV